MTMAESTTRGYVDAEAQGRAEETVGVLAEFDSPEALLAAAEKVRDAGYRRWDVFSPFPIHGMDEAMGVKPTILPWIVLGGGLAGLIGGVFLCWYTNAAPLIDGLHPTFQSYAYLISGKPRFSLPANIPVIFEATILLSAFAATFGMLGLNRLPQLYHPVFKRPEFARATQDRFFVAVDASDPGFDLNATTKLLTELEAHGVEELKD